MYLKSLVLKGFKSFADRSVITFEPGISAIVGPNGSGKSNISEAVLWVLGERKVTNLRVHSMEELIFSGSSARAAARVAEVDLVLDNSDGTIPIEFSEVVITRRMHHNGESEYLINGAPCLRRDIIDVLHDSGIGEGVHSVITQGNLTAMIESRPQDRKLLLEEAAGVLKHKARKERAARQLDKMDNSLSRVRDIVRVIDSQLKPLERQASRAKRYEEYAAELTQVSLALAVDDLRNLQTQWEQVIKREKEVDAEVELVRFRLEEKEEEVTKRQALLEQKGLFVGDLNEQRSRCQSIMARLDSNMRLLEEKGKNMVSRLSTLRGTIHTSQTRLKSAVDERDQMQTELEDTEARLKGLYASFNDLNRMSEQITKDRRTAQQEYDKLSSRLRNNESALAATKDNLTRAESSLESLDVEESLLKERMEQINADIAQSQAQLSEQRSAVEELSGDMLKAQGELQLARSDVDKRVRLLDQAKKRMNATRDALNDIQAQIRALQEVEKALDTASPSMNWLTTHKDEFTGVVDRLSKVISAPAELEPVVERLLGADISGLVVVDITSADLIAERLLKSGAAQGEVSFIPLSDTKPGPLPQSSDGQRLLDLVSYEQAYADVATSLLGDVYVADSVSQAVLFHKSNPDVRFATRDGAVVWPNGKITLGSQIADMEGVLSRQRKLNELLQESDTCSANLGESEMAVSEAEQALQLAQQDGFELSEQLAKLQGASDSAAAEAKRLEKQIMSLTSTRDQTELKLKSVSVRRGQSSPLAQEYRERIDALSQNIAEMRADVDKASKNLLDITRDKASVTEQLTSSKVEMEACRQSIDFRTKRVKKLDQEIRELKKTLDVSKDTEESLAIIRLRVDPLYRVFEELYEGIGQWARKLQEQARLTQSDSTSLKQIIDEAKKARDEARKQQEQVSAALAEVRVERAKLEAEVKHAIDKIETDNHTSIEAALQVPALEDRAQAEESQARLRKKIESLGAVNHVAMEEYENLKAQRDYIKGQMDDLAEARKKLTLISRALDNKMRRQFNQTFDDVNTRFKQIYEQLSPGDTGELVVLDKAAPDDEGGVEIVIHPHGMKLTSLTQLSGGQSALVAIAFLFAIYMTRSAPFYILDEIEPALDGTNLQRVCDLLDSMRGETQLIMVTHQRQTMEIADILYGVSKQASGVSKVVSQKLDQALRELEEQEAAEQAKAQA